MQVVMATRQLATRADGLPTPADTLKTEYTVDLETSDFDEQFET